MEQVRVLLNYRYLGVLSFILVVASIFINNQFKGIAPKDGYVLVFGTGDHQQVLRSFDVVSAVAADVSENLVHHCAGRELLLGIDFDLGHSLLALCVPHHYVHPQQVSVHLVNHMSNTHSLCYFSVHRAN